MDDMAGRRVTISEETYKALQAEGLVRGKSPGGVLEELVVEGISPKAREVLTTIGQTTATAKREKGDLSTKQQDRRPPLLASDSRKEKLIEMMKQPEPPTLEEMGARLGGYDKAAVSRAISKLRESGELEEGGGEISTDR